MYWNKSNVTAIKSNTIINYTKGSVLIEEKEVVLNYDYYTKRQNYTTMKELGLILNH